MVLLSLDITGRGGEGYVLGMLEGAVKVGKVLCFHGEMVGHFVEWDCIFGARVCIGE